MTYDFSTRLDRLGTRMKTLHSNSLTYTRTVSGTPIVITITNFTPERIDVSGLAAMGITIINDKLVDLVFDFSSLSTLSPPEPKAGDIIVWESRTYEVIGLGPSADQAQCFEYTTTSRLRVRVHCRQTI